MSEGEIQADTSNVPEDRALNTASENDLEGSEETDEEYRVDYGEGDYFEVERPKGDEVFRRKIEDKEWLPVGEYGEGGKYFIYRPEVESGELESVWGEASIVSSIPGESEEEKIETEEEREFRRLRESLLEEIRQKTLKRMIIKARNNFLQKKLVEHFKKRRMENVLKEDPKGLDLESKYLKRLYAFQEFKQAQEREIEELGVTVAQNRSNAKSLKEEVDEKLKSFVTRAYEVSLNLIMLKTGKKLNEKQVDRLLRRQIQKSEEKGKKKLKYIKLKNSIEDLEKVLKAMECIGEGLYFYEYEQIKIDNQNYNDKIEEKDDELNRIREKTEKMILQLANVRERTYAVEGDIELMEEQVYEVKTKFAELVNNFQMRERLTQARKKRSSVRDDYVRLKVSSGLLTRHDLLQDFEDTYFRVKNLVKQVDKIKKALSDKTKQHSELSKLFESANADYRPMEAVQPSLMRIASRRFF